MQVLLFKPSKVLLSSTATAITSTRTIFAKLRTAEHSVAPKRPRARESRDRIDASGASYRNSTPP
ncbi:MAG: hypothetical protein DRO39_05490 [Thermoprotei archaeon]|nr:MAG: hypothetical protein DRO39_05490 [Thermoprotei archaeon]